MHILVINSGSSSLKARLVDISQKATSVQPRHPPLLHAAIKDIGGIITVESTGQTAHRATARLEIRDHAHAWRVLFERLAGALGGLEAVGWCTGAIST